MQPEMQQNLVSVITPVYNRGEYITDALNSAWEQTYRPIEVIVVDDGSADDSADATQAWIAEHKLNRLFSAKLLRQSNRGACAARNLGLALARGEYIQWLDDDDIMYPAKIETQVRYLERHPEVDIVACQVDYLTAELKFVTRSAFRSPGPDEKMHHYLMRQDIIGFAPLYRRNLLEQIGGWTEGLPCGQDNDLHARLALSGGHFAIMDDVLAGVRMHKKNRLCNNVRFSRNPLMNDFDKTLFLVIVEKAVSLGKADETFKKLVAERLKAAAHEYFSRCMPDRACSCLEGAFEVWPDQISLWDYFCSTRCGFLVAAPAALAVKLIKALTRRAIWATSRMASFLRGYNASGNRNSYIP
jgi:glycosyltransferase involved in cell wall biosynthesis